MVNDRYGVANASSEAIENIGALVKPVPCTSSSASDVTILKSADPLSLSGATDGSWD